MLKVGMCRLIDTRTMLPPRSTGNILVWFLLSPLCAASGHTWYLSGTIHSIHRDLSLDRLYFSIVAAKGSGQGNRMKLTEIVVEGYEKVIQCQDAHSGLKAIISLHNTRSVQ